MRTIEESIDVHVPAQAAYDQWLKVEEFPEFMEDIEEVRPTEGNRLHWVLKIGDKRHEWDAVITDNVPGERIAWRSTSGKPNEGTVFFQARGDNVTRITIRISYEPEGVLERLAEASGLVASRVQGDLGRFKQLMESKSQEDRSRHVDATAGDAANSPGNAPRSKRLNEELAKQFAQATPPTTPSSAPGKM